jgi:hypothetical protein
VNPRKETNCGYEEDRGATRDNDDRGVLTLIAPRRHSLLWEFGPEGYRRAIEAFAEHPTLTRLVATAEAGLGIWLALRVYSAGGVSAGRGAWHGLRSRRVLKEGVRMAIENPALNERSFQRGSRPRRHRAMERTRKRGVEIIAIG